MEEHFKVGGHHGLVVGCAPAVNHPVTLGGGKRIHRPTGAVDRHNVLVAHEQQWTLAAIPFQARHNACAPGHSFKDLRLDAGVVQDTLQVVSDFRFVAGRILGIDSNQFRQEAGCLSLRLIGVESVFSCRAFSEYCTHEEETRDEGQERA